MTEPRFKDQVAIITGGAAGLGRHIAGRLAHEGAHVAIWDLDRAGIDTAVNEITQAGGQASGAVVDVGDEKSVNGAFAELHGRSKRLDIMIHCAGIVGPNARPITEVTVDEFDRVLRVNLRSCFLLTKQALILMKPRNYGRVLLFASIAGKEGNAGMCSYSTSKAGVIGLVKAVGKEFAETGITVNAIAPAVIRTAMVDALAPQQVTYMTDKIPMKRTGSLDEVASLSCWIVSPEASFNTAFTFDLSGGRATY
jgi:2-dehydro-3-deoxy-L-rhamnonate dehydrogenase (NAD+)